MQVELVQEWLAVDGGSENVTASLAKAFPSARISCLWEDPPSRFAPGRVHQSWLSRTPLRNHKALATPLMPFVWRRLPQSDADVVICSSHLFAHHARFRGPARGAPKLVYCHTPARYLWNPELDERGDALAVRLGALPLKAIDRRRAREPLSIACNSEFVRHRIAAAWKRESVVIPPPVDTSYFGGDFDALDDADEQVAQGLPSEFVLGASRLIPYKRLEDVIAVGKASGIPVVIAGGGPWLSELEAVAEAAGEVDVRFVGRPSQALLRHLYTRAKAYVFPPVEDFGIMPVEAMSCGTPVLGRSQGGTSETVVDGLTGALVDSFAEPAVLEAALAKAAACRPSDCRARADEFSEESFIAKIHEWVDATVGAGAG